MQGFFSKKETQSVSMTGNKINSCFSCGLSTHCTSPKMQPFGEFKSGILNIGSIPSQQDDINGKPWSDDIGHYLRLAYAKIGIDLFRDCLNINAVSCYTENATTQQVQICRKSVLNIIKEYQPKVIVLLGIEAIESVTGHRWQNSIGEISKWRGLTIPDQDLKAWVCPVYHPKDIKKNDKKEMEIIWMQDLKRALDMTKVPFKKDKPFEIDYIEDLSVLKKINSEIVSFDYETTGVKPHAKGHRIVCASVADSADHVFTFMIPETRQERQPFINLLTRDNIGKMAHNMKFEDTWTLVRLRAEVNYWEWDSMIAAHIIDNRQGFTGLKFQTYINFGVVDYASEVAPYLESGSKDGNAINNIMELTKTREGQHKLLTYCAMDSVYQFRLAMLQMKVLNYQYLPF